MPNAPPVQPRAVEVAAKKVQGSDVPSAASGTGSRANTGPSPLGGIVSEGTTDWSIGASVPSAGGRGGIEVAQPVQTQSEEGSGTLSRRLFEAVHVPDTPKPSHCTMFHGVDGYGAADSAAAWMRDGLPRLPSQLFSSPEDEGLDLAAHLAALRLSQTRGS